MQTEGQQPGDQSPDMTNSVSLGVTPEGGTVTTAAFSGSALKIVLMMARDSQP